MAKIEVQSKKFSGWIPESLIEIVDFEHKSLILPLIRLSGVVREFGGFFVHLVK